MPSDCGAHIIGAACCICGAVAAAAAAMNGAAAAADGATIAVGELTGTVDDETAGMVGEGGWTQLSRRLTADVSSCCAFSTCDSAMALGTVAPELPFELAVLLVLLLLLLMVGALTCAGTCC